MDTTKSSTVFCLNPCSSTETLEQKVVKNRTLVQGWKGVTAQSLKTYAKPLLLALKLRKSHFTVFGNILIPGSLLVRIPRPLPCSDTEVPVYMPY